MGTEPRPIPIPSKDVRVEAAFAGQAIVTHVAGIRLGTVERVRGGRDPEWEATTGAGRVVCGNETRACAVIELLDPYNHEPEPLVRRRSHKEVPEDAARRAFPEEWAWWDKVRPLFGVGS